MKGHKNGFTLVELMIVIAIVGLLIAILMPTIQKVVGGGPVISTDYTIDSTVEPNWPEPNSKSGRSCGCSNCTCNNNCKCQGKDGK